MITDDVKEQVSSVRLSPTGQLVVGSAAAGSVVLLSTAAQATTAVDDIKAGTDKLADLRTSLQPVLIAVFLLGAAFLVGKRILYS